MGIDEPDDKLQGAFHDRFDAESTAPPEVVWKHVHAAIVAEKKKRRFLFWLLPAVLFVGGGTALSLFFAFRQPANNASATAQTSTISSTSTVTPKSSSTKSLTPTQPVAGTNKAISKKQDSGTSAVTAENTSSASLTASRKQASSSGSKTASTPSNSTVRTGTSPARSATRTAGALPVPIAASLSGIPAETTLIAEKGTVPTSVEPPVARIATPPLLPETDTTLALLPAKSVLPWLTPSAVTPMKPFLPPPFPRWSFGMEIGLGKNNRNISGTYTENYKSLDLVSNDVKMANRCFGFSVGHRFNPYISLQTGITTGIDSYTSRWFLRLLTNQGTDGSYNFRTSEGNVRMASADVKDYFQNSDTAIVRMRLHHRSRYFSIPLSMKFTLPGQKLSPYFRLGASYDFYTNNRTAVLVNSGNGNISRTVNLSRAERGELHSTQLLLGIGFETHRNAAWQFFLEPQLSLPLSPIYGTTNFHVTSQYVQVRAGMTFYF